MQQDDQDVNRGSAAFLGLDEGLEQLLLAMQKNVTNQVQQCPACAERNESSLCILPSALP